MSKSKRPRRWNSTLPATPKKKAKATKRDPTRRAWINRTTKQRKPRKASETERIYGSKERRAWIKSLPCYVCTGLSPIFALVGGWSENAHTVTGGTGRKADANTIVPLCPSHHRRYDQHQAPLDQENVRDAIKAAAALYDAAWQARQVHTLTGTTE